MRFFRAVESGTYGPVASLLAVAMLLAGLVSTARGDYVYGWTEFSLEWLVDAGTAIALGQVTECGYDGRFRFRVDAVLKEAKGLDLKTGQTIEAPCLGRSKLFSSSQVGTQRISMEPRLGRPLLSDPATYPGSGSRLPPDPFPKLSRCAAWGKGDRCVLFFGPSLGAILQIVNLDEPVEVGHDPYPVLGYLAVDFRGKLVRDPKDLVRRIEQRVAEGRKSTADGSPRVCPHGFNYWPKGMELDSEDYYHVFVPPDPALRTWCKQSLAGGPPPDTAGPADCIWYWFYSGRTPPDFAAGRQNALERALDSLRKHLDLRGIEHARYEPIVDVLYSYRNGPAHGHGGWLCALSLDGRFLAYSEANFLFIYDSHAPRLRADEPLYRTDAVDRLATRMVFSSRGDCFAYAEPDGTPVVYDLKTKAVRWKGKLARRDGETQHAQQLCFSHDGMYLGQLVARGSPQRPSRMAMVYVWDAGTGRCVLKPYDDWQNGLRIVAFHRDEPRLIKLSSPIPRGARNWASDDLIWDLETGKIVTRPVDSKRWVGVRWPYSQP